MKRWLYLMATDQAQGWRATVVKSLLWVLSHVYRLLLMARRMMYALGFVRPRQIDCPVVSIGNITVGGVGKTPLTQWIAQALRARGVHPAILIRGYMASAVDVNLSDEMRMLKGALPEVPVIAGGNRWKGARDFLDRGRADLFLMDDGFQHWPLHRDLDVVVIDTLNPWGNGHLLPRGILREPKAALSRADVFVLTKADLGRANVDSIKTECRRWNPAAVIVEAAHRPIGLEDVFTKKEIPLTDIAGERVYAVCSIGSPESFLRLIDSLGALRVGQSLFMDHHMYLPQDFQRIYEACAREGARAVITTQKDAVKWKFPDKDKGPRTNVRILAARIEIEILQGKDALIERIHSLL